MGQTPWESSWKAGYPDGYTRTNAALPGGKGGLVCSFRSEGRQPLDVCISSSMSSPLTGHTSPRIGSSHPASSPESLSSCRVQNKPQGFSTILSGWEPGREGKHPLLGNSTNSLGDPPFTLVKSVIPCDPDAAYVVRELIMGNSYRMVTSLLWSGVSALLTSV